MAKPPHSHSFILPCIRQSTWPTLCTPCTCVPFQRYHQIPPPPPPPHSPALSLSFPHSSHPYRNRRRMFQRARGLRQGRTRPMPPGMPSTAAPLTPLGDVSCVGGPHATDRLVNSTTPPLHHHPDGCVEIPAPSPRSHTCLQIVRSHRVPCPGLLSQEACSVWTFRHNCSWLSIRGLILNLFFEDTLKVNFEQTIPRVFGTNLPWTSM